VTGLVAVTGATGLIGGHVTRALLDQGRRIRVLVRDKGRLERLPGMDVEAVEVDLADGEALRRALAGCELAFHVAGRIAGRDAEAVWAINAQAPPRFVEASAAAGLRRVVVTSTASAVGPAPPGEDTREDTPYRSSGFVYMDSKHAGEVGALDAGRRSGIDVVVVSPTYTLGAAVDPRMRGAPSTRLVGNYLRGRLPAIVESWNNFVQVGDVARGHLLAAEHGRAGERYLLGGENLTWVAFVERLRAASQVDHPVVVLPRSVERLASRERLLGLPNPLPREALRLMAGDWRYASTRARHELGYVPRPIDEALAATVGWYRRLIADGSFAGAGASSVDRLSRVVRGARRVGVLPALRVRVL
jgi:dihydroflavonol-4-reductase